MPYISQLDRKNYNEHLKGLLSTLVMQGEKDLGGHLNYCVSYLMTRLLEDQRRYFRVNTIRGAMENAIDEWYRLHAVPYEEKKRKENGDV